MKKSLLVQVLVVLSLLAAVFSGIVQYAGAETVTGEVFTPSDNVYLPSFPPAELCDESSYMDLARYLAEVPGSNLSGPHEYYGHNVYGYLFRSSTPGGFDTYSDGYSLHGVAFPNGTISFTYDSDGHLVSFYMTMSSSGIVAAEEERNATLLEIAKGLSIPTEGMRISHLTIPAYEVRNDDVVILSDSIGDQPLAGCNLFAAYFDSTSNRLVALEGRVFVPKVTPTISVAEAEKAAIAEVGQVKLSPLHNVSEVRCIGVRMQPIQIPISSYPIPGDDYNWTSSTERIYRYGYEFLFTINAQGVFEYQTLVVIDIHDCVVLMHWRQPYPDMSGGNGEIPARVLNVRAETMGGISLSWNYPTWTLASGGIKEFRIFRNTTGEEMQQIAVMSCPTPSGEETTVVTYVDTNVTSGIVYYYGVQAINYLGYGSVVDTFGPFEAKMEALETRHLDLMGLQVHWIFVSVAVMTSIFLFVLVRSRWKK